MKKLTAVLAMAVVAGFALTTLAEEAATRPTALYGKVVSVDVAGNKVVVATKEGKEVTVVTDANTKVRVSDKDATLGDVKPEMGIRVTPITGMAAEIRAFAPRPAAETKPAVAPTALYGKVVSVDVAGNKIVVATKEGKEVTVTTDASTKVRVSDKDATLGDVKAEMGIRVSPITGTAAEVRAFMPQPKPSK